MYLCLGFRSPEHAAFTGVGFYYERKRQKRIEVPTWQRFEELQDRLGERWLQQVCLPGFLAAAAAPAAAESERPLPRGKQPRWTRPACVSAVSSQHRKSALLDLQPKSAEKLELTSRDT